MSPSYLITMSINSYRADKLKLKHIYHICGMYGTLQYLLGDLWYGWLSQYYVTEDNRKLYYV